MNVKAGVGFHNRFDIEVRDKDTGELKQKGQAKNIILDRMYTRLCNFNSYFTNIVFGRGTGVTNPSRTTLFDRIDSKSATLVEVVKDFPVSKWTRSITLQPEEYVGETITEVGISETSTNINTHALIRDAEGNPLSIEKTDTDIVTIYATVFVELQNKSENMYWVNLPNNNSVLNYLLGGGSPSNTVRLGKKWTKGNLLNANQISSKTGSRTADTTNKITRLNTLRFGVNEGNGAIAEIEVFNSFKVTLPETGVFTEHNLKDIQIGIGDGENRAYNIPNIRAKDIIVKVDGNVTNEIGVEDCSYINFKVQDLTGVGNIGRGVSISPDGNTIATVSYNSPYFTVHRLNADTGEYEKMQDLIGVGSDGRGVSISLDGNAIITASSNSPYFTVHRLNADTGEYEKVQDLIGVGSDGRGVSFSPDGNTIITVSSNSPYFTVHRLNADTGEYEKMQDLIGVGSGGRGVSFSPDGNTIITVSIVSPYFTVHRLNADTGEYEKVQNLIGAGGDGQGVSITPDGNTIATASYNSPYFTVHRLNADTGEYEKVQNLIGVGDDGRGVSISPDGNTIATVSYNSPYFTVHRLNADTGEYEKVQNLIGAGDDGRGVSFSPDGNTLATASGSSPYFRVHNFEKTLKTIIFTTPPPEGAIITADYTVPYIPKSEDYVLDVTAEIQFGEGG